MNEPQFTIAIGMKDKDKYRVKGSDKTNNLVLMELTYLLKYIKK